MQCAVCMSSCIVRCVGWRLAMGMRWPCKHCIASWGPRPVVTHGATSGPLTGMRSNVVAASRVHIRKDLIVVPCGYLLLHETDLMAADTLQH
jgi:hypothetical protein